ncbi:MAG: hypothetical protein ABEJ72_08695 [Candidatus Aenigmatarchaeota archaeon]
MAGDQNLGSLFGSESSSSNPTGHTIPSSWKALGKLGSVKTKPRKTHSHVSVNVFCAEHSDDLETGSGRDDLVEKVGKHVNGDYDLGNVWNDYEPEDIIDLTVYLLDELDRKGRMDGREVVKYLEEFIEEEGNPDYLEDFEY